MTDMVQTSDQKAKSNGAETRAAAAKRKAELAANPVDWGKQIASIRDFMDGQDRRFRNERERQRRAEK